MINQILIIANNYTASYVTTVAIDKYACGRVYRQN